jgi:hypothetical protein
MSLRTRKIILGFIFLLLVALTGAVIYFAQKASSLSGEKHSTSQKSTAVSSSTNDVGTLVGAVGKLILLPQGEEPTIATVSDPSKLSSQPFFANAKVGHKVLIYQKAKKAYLYDAENNMLIEVAPINIGDTPTTAPASTTQSN